MSSIIEFIYPKSPAKRHLLFQTVLILNIIALAILVLLAKANPYFKIDLFITQLVQQINLLWFDVVMKTVTNMGNATAHTILATFFVILVYFVSSKKDSLALFLSAAGAYLLGVSFKTFVARPRPDPSLIHQLGNFNNADSFPSGHVLYFMGLYGFLFFLTYIKLKPGPLKITLLTIFAGLIFLVGLSRIYLGAHWFSDILGAYLIGMIWLYVIIKIYQRLFAK